MSIGRFDPEEEQCDMPFCYEKYDHTNGAEVALLGGEKNNQIMAFCRNHCKQLQSEGITLKTLTAVHDELHELVEGPKRREEERKKLAAQNNFIDSLKRNK